MGITLNVEQYLKDLEYLVNIDSQSKDPEGVAKVAAFFEKRRPAWLPNIPSA